MTGTVARGAAERHGALEALEALAVDEGQEGAKTSNQTLYQLLPALTEEEYRALKADIQAHGIQVLVLDGHHRLRAARELGLPDEAIPRRVRPGLSEEQKLEHVLRLNLLRRQLTRAQKQALAVQLRQRGWTQERIARAIGVHQAQVSRWLRDVMHTHNVDAESGNLPRTITDTRGRAQPATQTRRSATMAAPAASKPDVMEPAADVPKPAPSLLPSGASAGLRDTLREQPTSAAVAQQGTRAPSSSADTITGLSQASATAEAAAAAEPKAAAPVAPAAQGMAWAYLRVCQPEHFPEPGPLDAEGYDRAVSFEVALNVLRRIRDRDGGRVLRPWQRWHEHHGNLKAGEQAAELLQNLAGYMKANLLPAKSLRGKTA